jgi:hypothetical protein
MTTDSQSHMGRVLHIATNLVIVAAATAYVIHCFQLEFLLLPTVISGGDTPSHFHPAVHMRDVLLPMGRTVGWDMGNYAGYPLFQFYFPVPFLMMALLGHIMPMEIAFKLVTAIGPISLPAATFYMFWRLRYPFPLPAIASTAVLPFLIQQGNSMWGGNIPSTLAGEFCHSIGLSFGLLFIGSVYRGLHAHRSWVAPALLLAACGLSHTYAFFFAGLTSFCMLPGVPSLRDGVKYLFTVGVFAFCFMAFWAVPLVEKIGFTTAWVFSWKINAWIEVLPKPLWPLAGLAALNVLLTLGGLRQRGASQSLLWTLVGLGTAIMYVSAPALDLVDIRFVPTLQILLCFLSVDLLALFVHHVKPRIIFGLLLAGGAVVWTNEHIGYIPHWIKWNYEGFQQKRSWETFRDLTGFLKGTYADPRVAYEFSPETNKFGTVRAFESIPHFSGRQTLEGTLIHSAINAPFIYYMQSEISETGTHPIPGYTYSSFNITRGTEHLRMFNVRDMIAVSDMATKAYRASDDYEEVFRRGRYTIFRLKDTPGQYVTVPKYWPVLLETNDWRRSFHRWFKEVDLLDVPLVPTDMIPEAAGAVFDQRATSLDDLPRRPVDGACTIDEVIGDAEVSFTTTCPGKPHIVGVSYFPNWRVEGADRIYPVSPAFMLVFPTDTTVRLTYGRTRGDLIGWLLTIVALLSGAVALVRQRAAADVAEGASRGALGRAIDGVLGAIERHPWRTTAVLVIAVGAFTTYSALHRREAGAPDRRYFQAWEAFQAKDYDGAIPHFRAVIATGAETYLVPAAHLYGGWSLLQLGKTADAAAMFEQLIADFPDSIYQIEGRYHLAGAYFQLGRREDAVRMYRTLIEEYPKERWAEFAADRLREIAPGDAVPKPKVE